MCDDNGPFNSIMKALNAELAERNLNIKNNNEIHIPWLQSFCFLVDMHMYYLYDTALFHSDFIINDQSGCILHKQISEQFLLKEDVLINYNGPCRIIPNRTEGKQIFHSELSSKETVNCVQEIVHGLVSTLSKYDNPLDLTKLFYEHGKFHDNLKVEPTTTVSIRVKDCVDFVRQYYTVQKKVKRSKNGNVIKMFE